MQRSVGAIEPGKCELCGQLHVGVRACFYDELREVLAGVELSPEEDRHLRWLARWDRPTVDAFVSLFKRLRAQAR